MKQLFWLNFGLAIFTAFLVLILAVVALMYGIYLDDEHTTEGEFAALLGYLGFFAVISTLHFVAWPGLRQARSWVWVPLAVAVTAYALGAGYLASLG